MKYVEYVCWYSMDSLLFGKKLLIEALVPILLELQAGGMLAQWLGQTLWGLGAQEPEGYVEL